MFAPAMRREEREEIGRFAAVTVDVLELTRGARGGLRLRVPITRALTRHC
jgi:hypothetical protein